MRVRGSKKTDEVGLVKSRQESHGLGGRWHRHRLSHTSYDQAALLVGDEVTDRSSYTGLTDRWSRRRGLSSTAGWRPTKARRSSE